MEPALRALNSLQSVPWKINTKILDVIRKCPELEVSDNTVMYFEHMETAERLAKEACFYTAMNLDFRGRVYGVPNFNFQGEDYVRALFLFAERTTTAIGAQGEYWLKVHLANRYGLDNMGKKTFDERVAWVDQHIGEITDYANDPLKHTQWKGADKQFQFLAACMELAAAEAAGVDNYVSHLPVTFDGSCNGLQHLCAMTRAPESKKVNLTAQPAPQDIYQTVADRLKERIERDRKSTDKRGLAEMCLKYIWDTNEPGRARKVVKRPVMTFPYSSKQWGMADQIFDDTMRPLSKKFGKEHPFGSDGGKKASSYLAKHIYQTITEVIKYPADTMRFLQQLVSMLAEENRSLQWTTPAGVPWINRYHTPRTKQIRLRLSNFPVKVKIADGYEKSVAAEDAKNAVAPNLVHALDAAHLMLTVNAANKEGIKSLATVHDCFGCLAVDASRFRQIIREQFVWIYENCDPLNELRKSAWDDLRDEERRKYLAVVPAPPPKETQLDIKSVLNAKYAFA